MKKKAVALAAACVLCMNGTAFAAPNFKDVPSTHWAYSAISAVSDRGLMVGDPSGNFNPNNLIDKFDTMRILARAAGYNYTNPTDAELNYYNRAYDKNKAVLASYNQAFTKWNSSADRETAFLIEKQVVTLDDLNQFVIKDANQNEKLRALSREEAVVFLVRLLGKEAEARAQTYALPPFNDQAGIAPDHLPLVRYMQSKGVVAGDDKGNFNPNGAVTRAAMALMLDKTLALAGNATTTITPLPSNGGVATVAGLSGTFDKYYPQLDAVQLVLPDGKKKIYRLSSHAVIYVDSYLKTAQDLQEGMPLTALAVNDDEIQEIKATSITQGIPVSPSTTPSYGSTGSSVPQTPQSGVSLQNYYVEGTVVSFNSLQKTISVQVKMLSPKGEIIAETQTFPLSADCQMTRGGTALNGGDVLPGEVVRVDYSGGVAFKITLEEKERTFTGATLAEKRYITATQTPVLVLQESTGKKYDLRITGDTRINRRGTDGVAWTELRIGDTIDAKAEYDRLVSVTASGTYTTVEGIVSEVRFSQYSSTIVLQDQATGLLQEYGLAASNMYELRLGSWVRLNLDSKEAVSFTGINGPSAKSGTITGTIQSRGSNAIFLRDETNQTPLREIKYDVNTIVTNAKTGSRVNPDTLYPGQRIKVTISSQDGNLAETIQVLED